MSDPRSPITFSMVMMFLGSFLLVLAFAVILQQIGAPAPVIMLWMLSFVLGAYIFSGMFANTMRFSTFQDGDRNSTPVFAGMAMGAGIVSGQVLLLSPGAVFQTGAGFLPLYGGILLGLVLAGVLFSAGLARTRTTTIAGLIFPRASSPFNAIMVVTVICATGMLLLLAQLKLTGLLAQGFFGIREGGFVNLMLGITTAYLVAGGMPALRLARVLSYAGLAFGILVPLVWISFKISGNPVPQFSFGSAALQPIMEIDREMVEAGFAKASELPVPAGEYADLPFLDSLVVILTIGCGIAAMPHLLQHFGTLKKGADSRSAGVWGLFFAAVLLSVVPAIAIFARYNLYTSLLGLQISDLNLEAPWLFDISGGGSIPLVTICGSLVSSIADILATCHVPIDSYLGIQDIAINPDYLVLGSAVLAELPSLMTVVTVCGAVFMIVSTLDGILLTMANTLTNDIYARLIGRRSPPGFRLFANRLLLVLVAVTAAIAYPLVGLSAHLLFALSLALGCATIFPALGARMWLKLFNDHDLSVAMIGGLLTTLSLLFLRFFGPDAVYLSGDEWIVQSAVRGLDFMTLFSGSAGLVMFFVSALAYREIRKRIWRKRKLREANATA